MSYDLIYNKLCLKTESGLILPMVLIGCSNCTEQTYSSRGPGWRRERSWGLVHWFGPKALLHNPDEHIKNIKQRMTNELSDLQKTYSDPEHIKVHGEYDWSLDSFDYCGLKINGKSITYRQQQSYFINIAKNAISIEEYLKHNGPFSLDIYKNGRESMARLEDKSFRITSDEVLNEASEYYDVLLSAKADNESIYVSIRNLSENYRKARKEKSERVKKEYPCYWVIQLVGDYHFLKKKSSRHIWTTINSESAKKFIRESDVERYIKDKLAGRLHKYESKKIDEPIMI